MRKILALLAIPAVMTISAGAFAQGVDPQCAKMGDRVGCTCALASGGSIRPDGRGWRQPNSRGRGAFVDCLKAHGKG